MTESDRDNFTKLMIVWGEISVDKNKPSPDKIDMYFELLKDVPFAIIDQLGSAHFQKNEWFPAPCKLRPQSDPEVEAQEAFSLLKAAIDRFYSPDFGQTSFAVMESFLEDHGRPDLKRMLPSWGAEIAYGNISVVRAQFLKAYDAALRRDSQKQLAQGNEFTKLGDIEIKQLEK